MTHHQITWKTNKTAAGFAWQVWSFGYGMPTETLKTGICPTRAKALGEAKRWCLWFKAKARRDEGDGSFVAWFGSYDPPTSRGDAALTSAVIMNVRVERDPVAKLNMFFVTIPQSTMSASGSVRGVMKPGQKADGEIVCRSCLGTTPNNEPNCRHCDSVLPPLTTRA